MWDESNFIPNFTEACDYLSMPGLKLYHVSKGGSWWWCVASGSNTIGDNTSTPHAILHVIHDGKSLRPVAEIVLTYPSPGSCLWSSLTFIRVQYIQCGADLTRLIFCKILIKDTPQPARYGVSFLDLQSNLYSTSTAVMMYIISCYIEPR